MALETPHPEWLAGASDRRRVPRFSCSGQAQIACLPLSGALLRGTVRDVGLGGCCIEGIETIFRFDLGAPTEILVEVNSWFFRAMAQVRAVRGCSGISMEFVRMSAGGYSMLAELVADLERPRAAGTRQRRLLEQSPQLLRGKPGRGSELSRQIVIAGTIVPAQPAGGPSQAKN
jgi:hypothetical protein